jgi:hypothetical protein
MKKFALGATTALAALTWLGTPASAQAPGGFPSQAPAPVVSAAEVPPAMPAGFTPVTPSYGSSYDTLSGTPGYATTVGTPVGVGGTRFYGEASYLLMFVSSGGGSGVPLATGGPSNGVLGRPGTTTLLDASTSYNTLSGFKLGVGGLNGATSLGFEANVMVFGSTGDGGTVGPTSNSTLARPFYDTATRAENSVVLASPGAFAGSIDARTSFTAYGAEANPFFRLVQGNSVNFDLITGFRYFAANEGLDVYDSRQVLAGGVSAFNGIGIGQGSQLLVHDHISARNQFYGANLGGRLSYASGAWFIDLTGKVAIGGVHQIVTRDGTTTLVGGGLVGPTTTGGGFLANLGNAGSSNNNGFAVLPEANLQVGYQATSWLNVFAGYQVMYLSNMARPVDQVDRNINSSRLATVNTFNSRNLTSTAGTVNNSDLFIHGFNFGLTIVY